MCTNVLSAYTLILQMLCCSDITIGGNILHIDQVNGRKCCCCCVVVVVNLPLFSSSKDSQLSLMHTTQTSPHPSPTYITVMAFSSITFSSNTFCRTFLSNTFLHLSLLIWQKPFNHNFISIFIFQQFFNIRLY